MHAVPTSDSPNSSRMSSMQRTITGDILVQHLGQDAMTIDRVLLAKHGRSARTLAKDGPLRLTLMALAPGGNLPAHSTDNPVSIHVVQGEVSFYAIDQEHALATGGVLILAPGVEHARRIVPPFARVRSDAWRGVPDRTRPWHRTPPVQPILHSHAFTPEPELHVSHCL